MTRARNSANLASHGNLFVDIANDRTGIGSVVPAQNLHVAGTAGFHADTTFTGDLYNATWDRSDNSLKFVDNAKIKIGTGGDLQIYHDGSHSILNDSQGSLLLRSNIVQISTPAGSKYFKGQSGSAELYFSDNKKFETTAYGTNTTGTAVNDGLVVAGVATVTTMNVTGVLTYDDVTSVDSVGIVTARAGIHCSTDGVGNGIRVGAGGDLIIQHNGTDSFVDNNTGDLYLQTTGSGDDIHIESADDFFVKTAGTQRVKIEQTGDIELGSGSDLTTHVGSRQRVAILGSSSNGSMLHIRGGSPAIFFDQSGGNIGKIYQDNANLAFHANTPASEGTNTFLLTPTGNATFAGTVTATSFNGDVTINDSIIHNGDTNTKIRFPTTDTITAETAGSERLRIKSDGKIGIGVNNTNPSFQLQIHESVNTAYAANTTVAQLAVGNVNSSSATNAAGIHLFTDGNGRGVVNLSALNNSTSSSADFVIQTRHSATIAERLRILSTGQVTIGTTVEGQASADKLTLSGSGTVGMTIRSTNSVESNIFMSDATTGSGEYAGWIKFKHNTTPNRWEFGAVNTQIFNILADGKVGINESSPLGKLHVKSGDSGVSAVGSSADELVLESNDNAGMSILSATDGEGGINFGDSGDINIGKIAYNHSSNSMFFKTNDVERLRITADGRIGINDSSPNDYELDIMKRSTATDANLRLYNNATGSSNDTILRLHIAGTSASNYIYFGDGDDSNVGQIRYQHSNDSMQFYTGAGERLRITSDGKFSLGTINATPSAAVHIDYDTNNMLMLDNSTASTQKIFFAQNAATHAQIYGTSNVGALTLESDPSNNHNNSYINFKVDAAERFRITSGGNVGINTTNPDRYLHIVGNDGATGATLGNSDTILHLDNRGVNGPIVEFTSDANSAARIQFTDTDAANRGRLEYVHSNDSMRFHTSGTERIRIDSNGHFRPTSDSLLDLGTSSVRWRNVYADTLYGDGSNLTGLNTDLVSDTSPQLGADLDVNDFDIKNGNQIYEIVSNARHNFKSAGNTIMNINGNGVDFQHGNNTHADSVQSRFGTGNDLAIYHNGSNSFIQHSGTGDLFIDTLNNSADMYIRSKDNLHLRTNSGAQESVVCVGNSGVILYNAGVQKFTTNGDGIRVTGRVEINDSNTRIEEGSSNALRLRTNNGYVDIGPMNGTFCHIQTDRSLFYFNTRTQFNGHVEPYGTNTHNLGASNNRWKTIFTMDLELSNEAKGGNDVDGTWGNWTLQEGEHDIYMINNRTGKKFKIKMEEVE